jgi:hypothetical protein
MSGYVQQKSCKTTPTASDFVITPSQDSPICPSTTEQANMFWYILTMEYYKAMEKNRKLKNTII